MTSRFHAKIFIFDDAVLLGSSNLTDGGLKANREAVIRVDRDEDVDAVEDVRSLFVELWDAAHVLIGEKLSAFEKVHRDLRRKLPNPEKEIENAVGAAHPHNINVRSHEKSGKRIFLKSFRVWLIKAALISSSCRPPDHEADAGDGNPGNGAFDVCLDILCRTAAASRPGEGTLRHPAAGQQLEPLGCSLSRGSGISVIGFWKFRKRKFIARWRIQDILEGSLKTIRAPLKSDALRRPAQ